MRPNIAIRRTYEQPWYGSWPAPYAGRRPFGRCCRAPQRSSRAVRARCSRASIDASSAARAASRSMIPTHSRPHWPPPLERRMLDQDLALVTGASRGIGRAIALALGSAGATVVGTIGNVGQVHYSAAKAGLVGFTKALAREVATRNITVNTVAPGFIETDMTRSLTEAQRAAYLSQIPAGRFGAAEEVANTVAFLASREAAYITGQTLHVNGGLYMG